MTHTSSQSMISPNHSLVGSNLVELREKRHYWKLFLGFLQHEEELIITLYFIYKM
jgi:hypothetical protein